jgi:predicted GNAT family acetyltransferase
MRLAAAEDLDILTQWQTSFLQEALGEYKPEMARRSSERRIATGEAFIWDDNGPVAMAVKTRPTPHGCTVSGVYTPPELRGRGYASSCVAALSQHLLDAGKQFCNLFTDLANPTSNSIYQKIGYEPVCDFTVYRFDEKEE